MLSAESVNEVLAYDRGTGKFAWRKGVRNRNSGKPAGTLAKNGYIEIAIGGKKYRAHRLAWLLVFGETPACDIDHIDGNKANNRIENLRLSTRAQNKWNVGITKRNKSGYKGVSWCKQKNKWRATIRINNVQRNIGFYSDIEEAGRAYRNMAIMLHGEYFYHA